MTQVELNIQRSSPKVSVIIPCYNAGAYLDEAVDSVLSQTFQNFEIIVVDDGSTDPATLWLLDHYGRPKTEVLRIKNQGLATARTVGIARARGKYILPLDVDDKMGKSYLASASKILDANPEIAIVYCRARFFGARQGEWDLPPYSLEAMLIDNVIFATAMFRKDDLLATGRRIVAIGGSDAHSLLLHLGPLSRVIFPYKFHFKTVNTHLLVPEPLTGDVPSDKKMIYTALAEGHCFVGYDLPASTKGFTFKAKGREQSAIMGDTLPAKGGVTLQAHLPRRSEIRLLKDGIQIGIWKNTVCTHTATEPGVYRVEAYINYLGKKRGWIYSNPIYVR